MILNGFRSLRLKRRKIAAISIVIAFLGLVFFAFAADRRAYVNYSQGMIERSVNIAGVPVWRWTQSIFVEPREKPTTVGEWELISRRDFIGNKHETAQAKELAALKLTIEQITLISDDNPRFQKKVLVEEAWNAAESHDLIGLERIQKNLTLWRIELEEAKRL